VYTASFLNVAWSPHDRWVTQLMPGLKSTGPSSLTTDKSAVAEQTINFRHRTQLEDTSILSAKSRYMDCIIRRQVRLRSTPTICKSWKHLIQLLKEERSPSSYNCHNGIFQAIKHLHNALLGHSSFYSFFSTSTIPLPRFSSASCS
jgi:hypothetical protein